MRTTPRIQALRDELIKSMSRPMAKKVLTSLKAILKDAKRRGNVAQNAAADVSITSHGRIKTKPQVGRDIPTRDEIRRIIGAAAPGKGRAFLLTAALTGMRASELRGLRWADVDLNKRQIHVRQRADHWRMIGQPKSAAGARTIPIEDMVVNTLREWKLQCPKGTENLVFPTGVGTVDYLANFMHRYVQPAQVAAGVVDSKGKAKYGTSTLLVHPPEGRWRPRAAAKDRSGAAGTRQHRHDARSLWPSIPRSRRWRRACGCGQGAVRDLDAT